MEKSKEIIPGQSFKWLLVLVLLFCGQLIVIPASGQSKEPFHNLVLKLEGVSNDKGLIRITVFNKEEGFPEDSEKAVKTISVPAQQGVVKVVLDKLPAGNYAIAVLHDENKNGKLDTNLVGYPKEGYGFSNNNLPTFRAHRFEEAAFTMSEEKEELSVRISY